MGADHESTTAPGVPGGTGGNLPPGPGTAPRPVASPVRGENAPPPVQQGERILVQTSPDGGGPVPGGRLVVVGTGIRSIAQITTEAAAWIRAADIVCYALADPLTERWVVEHAARAEDLSRYYDEATTRLVTYARMAARLVDHARAGRTVVGVFYGHPGVFTDPSHDAVALARAEGIPAQMLPGVSAEDCLFADLGIDPGLGARESYEATEMLLRGRTPSADAHVVIWQIAVLAQRGYDRRAATSDLRPLVDHLARTYPPDHVVTHYQGAQLVLAAPVVERVPLRDLVDLRVSVSSTLYVPPLRTRPYDLAAAAALGLDRPSGDPEVAPALPRRAAGDRLEPLPDREWYVPLREGRSRVYELLAALSQDPSLVDAFRSDPSVYVATLGLDPIETWAVLSGNATAMLQCVRHGSGPAAAVAMGLADSEDEARTYTLAADGRLMRPRRRDRQA